MVRIAMVKYALAFTLRAGQLAMVNDVNLAAHEYLATDLLPHMYGHMPVVSAAAVWIALDMD